MKRTAEIITGCSVAALVGIGALAGGVLGEVYHDDAQEEIPKVHEQIAHQNELLLDADLNLDRREVQLGEGCTALLRNFGPEGSLFETPEDSIVSDLLSVEDTPCGDNAVTVRAATRDYLEAVNLIPEIQSEVHELEDKVDRLHDQAGDNEEIWAGALIGGFFCFTLSGMVAEDILEDVKKRRSATHRR